LSAWLVRKEDPHTSSYIAMLHGTIRSTPTEIHSVLIATVHNLSGTVYTSYNLPDTVLTHTSCEQYKYHGQSHSISNQRLLHHHLQPTLYYLHLTQSILILPAIMRFSKISCLSVLALTSSAMAAADPVVNVEGSVEVVPVRTAS
jgi:hypothetical protein